MKHVHDLSALQWTVEGYTPNLWLFERLYGGMGGTKHKCIDVPSVTARVPGSVQGALREAGILPDWNVALNARQAEQGRTHDQAVVVARVERDALAPLERRWAKARNNRPLRTSRAVYWISGRRWRWAWGQ